MGRYGHGEGAPGSTASIATFRGIGFVHSQSRGRWLITAAVLTLLLAGRPAAADDPSAWDSRPGPGRWFGWQVALVDLGSIALISGGGVLTSRSSGFAFLPIVGGAAYFAGGPIVHALHGDSRGAWRSVLLRVGVPVGSAAVFGGLAALTASGERSDLCFPRGQRACAAVFGAVAGFGVGMIAAMVTDWIVSSEPPRAPMVAGSTSATDLLTWSFAVIPQPGGSTFGVAGRF